MTHLLNYWLKVAFNFFLIRTILYIERMNPWYCNWKVWLHYLLGFPAHSMLKAYYHTIIGHIQNTITAWNFILSSSWSKSTTIYPTDSTIKGFGKLFFCEIKDVSQWSHLCLLLLFCRDLDEDFFNTFSFISVQEWGDRLSKSIPVPSRPMARLWACPDVPSFWNMEGFSVHLSRKVALSRPIGNYLICAQHTVSLVKAFKIVSR